MGEERGLKYLAGEIRKKLLALSAPEYRKFSQGLISTNKNVMLGVKLPLLRKLAAEISKGDWREFLDGYDYADYNVYYEEIMLQGLVLDCARMELAERLERVEKFIPKIDNWAVCDTFCMAAKWISEAEAEGWKFLQKYLKSDNVFEIRFGVIMLLSHFLSEEYIESVLYALNGIECVRQGYNNVPEEDNYYAEMAVAWCIATAAAKFRENTFGFLDNTDISARVLRKAAQKMRDSYRISDEDKMFITALVNKKKH